MAGNVLVGGIIGAGVDVASGAMLDLTPNPAIVVMEKDDGSLPMPSPADAASPPPPPAPPANAPPPSPPPAPPGV